MIFFDLAHAFMSVASVADKDKIITTGIYGFKGDHCAIVYAPDSENPLVRIHSECLTGDVFGSKRCDCGDQLKTAQAIMEKEGGIILYLRQEGRGVGLLEKIKSYQLQDGGKDTYEAGRELGHADDSRDFTIAADMLKALGVKQCRLMTNNFEKAFALNMEGINVTEEIPMPALVTRHNRLYLEAKERNGHTGLLPK